jgi:hypothetical protein
MKHQGKIREACSQIACSLVCALLNYTTMDVNPLIVAFKHDNDTHVQVPHLPRNPSDSLLFQDFEMHPKSRKLKRVTFKI